MCLGYPQEEAAIVALKAIRDFLEHDHNLVTYLKFLHLSFYTFKFIVSIKSFKNYKDEIRLILLKLYMKHE